MSSVVERFSSLFAGLERVFGQYLIQPGAKADERGKIEGRAMTWKDRSINENDWVDHLVGKRGLGICPLTDDHVCRFGALDIDVYPIDPKEIYAACEEHDIPLILCRSKSGGVHGYVFFEEMVEATMLRERLNLWATLLGHSGCEVFPKQDRMDEDGCGNWINLPYFGGDRSLRYAYGHEGSLTVEEFLDFAESKRMSRNWLETWTLPEIPEEEPSSDWYESPPCLRWLGEHRGFVGGKRNNGFFNLCIYLKKRYEGGWKDVARAYNQRFFDSPMRDDEMRDTLRSVGRKDYRYMCNKTPIIECCDRVTCVNRRFGVGSDGEKGADICSVELGVLTKIESEPPTWRILANGRSVELTTEELVNQSRFTVKMLEVTNVLGAAMKPSLWLAIIRDKLSPEELEIITVPPEGQLKEQILHHLNEFCKDGSRGNSIEDLLRGRPWTDVGRTYFVPADFFDYLSAHKIAYTRAKLQVILHDIGCETHKGHLKGCDMKYWSVPERTAQSEPFEVPRVEREEPF